MNYYPFHLGDYASHTAHLEPMEDLAYRRMLDLYYLRECALPGDPAEVARLIRLRGEIEAIETVLREFFTFSEDDKCFIHMRCEQELSRMQDKQTKAKASAEASVNARRANAQRTLNERSMNAERTDSERSTEVELPTPTPTPIETPPTPRGGDGGQGIPSRYGEVVLAMKAAGMPPTMLKPHDQEFRALVDAGATPAEFAAVVPAAMTKGKPWPYAVSVVEGSRRRAKEIADGVHKGAMPTAAITTPGESVEAYQARMAAEREAERKRLEGAKPAPEVLARLADLAKGMRTQ